MKILENKPQETPPYIGKFRMLHALDIVPSDEQFTLVLEVMCADDAKERALANAALADNGNEFAAFDAEIETRKYISFVEGPVYAGCSKN